MIALIIAAVRMIMLIANHIKYRESVSSEVLFSCPE